MSSQQTGICHRCGRELRGAIETNFMSLGRLVSITTIETPDCNWTRCRMCRKSVCKSCYLKMETMCTCCFVKKQYPLRPVTRNGTGGEGPNEPEPLKRAA